MSGSPRNQDLGFTPSIFGAGAGIFFIGYLLLALTLATVGIYAAVSIFWSLSTAILTGTGAAAPSSIRLTISGALPGCARRRDRRTVRPDRACRRESSPQFPAQASNYSSLGSGDAGGSSFALCFASGAWLALTFVRAARCFPLKLALSCREADLEGLRQ